MRTARDVLDYMSWLSHCAYVNDICDSPTTTIAVFDCFKRSASAERGRYVVPESA